MKTRIPSLSTRTVRIKWNCASPNMASPNRYCSSVVQVDSVGSGGGGSGSVQAGRSVSVRSVRHLVGIVGAL